MIQNGKSFVLGQGFMLRGQLYRSGGLVRNKAVTQDGINDSGTFLRVYEIQISG